MVLVTKPWTPKANGNSEFRSPKTSVSDDGGGGHGMSRPQSVSGEDMHRNMKTKSRFGHQKMDLARATGLMGFNSQRWQDTQDPKGELDKALFNRTQDLLKKQRQIHVS